MKFKYPLTNLIGTMHWDACQSCENSDKCGKNKNKVIYAITKDEVICKNHQDIMASIGKINMVPACETCQIFNGFFKICGLETMYESKPVEISITSTEVYCLSWIKKGE